MPANVRQDKNMTRALLSKMGKYCFDDVDLGEINGFELVPDEALRCWRCR